MQKRVAILQSNYIPWKGYFDLLNSVDEFIFYDEMQFTKRDWRNRNKIATPDGLLWLTIPVSVKGRYFQKINETKISDLDWAKKHWRTIEQFYCKSKFFDEFKGPFQDFYMNCEEVYLSKINVALIKIVNKILKIKTKLSFSEDFSLIEGRTDRILDLCSKVHGNIYVSGPAAKGYFDERMAASQGIKVEWFSYTGYPEYRQANTPFEHEVSILDLIFNEGLNATKFMKSFE